jgi:hypothetical protein
VAASWLRTKTRLSVIGQIVWHYRLTVLASLSALYGLVSVITGATIWVNIGAAVVGVLIAIGEIIILRTRARPVVFQARLGDDYRDVVSDVALPNYVVRAGASAGVIYGAEGKQLRDREIPAVVDAPSFALSDEHARWSVSFLLRSIRSSTLHNGRVVGLASDLPAGPSGQPVRLRRCGYFDFVSTNILASYDIREAGDFTVRQQGRRLFIDSRGQLRTFERSHLANTVGVSTLAFTTDGKLLVTTQSSESLGSPGLMAPSGSGALEQQDLQLDSNVEGKLSTIISRGAERELCEECFLDPAEVDKTEVIGYGRWLSRGGMPEFSAVSILDVSAGDVVARGVRHAERPYVDDVQAIRLHPVDQWQKEAPQSMLPDDDRFVASWPLLLGLAALADAMQDPSWKTAEELRVLLA